VTRALKEPRLRIVLSAYVALNVVLGAWFLLAPMSAAAIFPWPVAPLAARFMGSLFLAGAACGLVNLLLGPSRGLMVLALVAAGDLLIASVGLLALDQIAPTGGSLAWFALFVVVAILLLATVVPAVRGLPDAPVATPRSLRRYFRIHLAVVLPVGLAMFLVPAWAQGIWPWTLSPINVRLLGAFFVGAAVISLWSQAQASWHTVLPALALYAVFASAATIAAVVHRDLFDPARIVTWVFFALYVFVAAGAWWFLVRYPWTGRAEAVTSQG
jgi:hypothetical protein